MTARAPVDSPSVQFEDATQAAGIRFKHNNGAAGKKWMPETVGSGCAFLDYNNDGWPDILLINSKDWPDHKKRTSWPALYRNNKDGTFRDVTKEAGLAIEVYGMGCAVGDYDNDGWDDVYITCLGPNYLFRNNRNGTFSDHTRQARVAGVPVEPGGLQWKWSASAAWFDYDNDGWLDLFVCNYIKWTPQTDVWCGHLDRKGYCPPDRYEPVPSTLYRNNRNGTFTDVSAATGIGEHAGKSFGVAPCDYDGDGWVDLAVANDGIPNFLFMNVRGQRFEERAVEAGIALGNSGEAKAGMGIDVADWTNTGRFGLLIGNFSREALSLFENDGSGLFEEIAYRAGLGEPSLLFLTFGLFFFDYDLDGWKDVFTANGHIDDIVDTYDSRVVYRERPLLFHNGRNGAFEEVGPRVGKPFESKLVARGCAWGDFDNDGDPDILVMDNNGPTRLWRNAGSTRNHWLRVKLIGTRSNRNGFGARVKVQVGGVIQTEYARSGCSFLSQSDSRLLFGLGANRRIDAVEVTWPGGAVTRLQDVPADQELVIRESVPPQP